MNRHSKNNPENSLEKYWVPERLIKHGNIQDSYGKTIKVLTLVRQLILKIKNENETRTIKLKDKVGQIWQVLENTDFYQGLKKKKCNA